MNLEELQKEEAKLIAQLKANRENQKEILETIFQRENGFFIGNKIEYVEGGVKKTGIISGIEYLSSKIPNWYIVSNIKKDGQVGKKRTKIWKDWLKTAKLVE